ncbi:HprK-related kinase B [Roseovarius tolerans]|uniref:HprK-related kinase B n=1 Tax=Roseovarius tolerans TaxID=74031 RepID=A0A1H8ADP2_9RHOB|nr:HprK-related kinase B [Roseovarius tolerans]SEM68673.1 HprK-related kinase B [Roseovarius tolerans]
MSLKTVSDVLVRLDRSGLADAVPLILAVGPYRLRLRCKGALRAELATYFADVLSEDDTDAIEIDILDGQPLDPAPEWQDWAREPGKTGRKDAIHDLVDGRLVFKRHTGVTFLQSDAARVAFGPVSDNPNQVINFVNTQILNACLREGWQICHAAAVTSGARTLAIAGLSGGGKSTSVLRMMDLPGTAFVTNDRLMVRGGAPLPIALGIPKHPRINPGTILHNARLHRLLTPERLTELAAMPPEDLWHLEEKHDLIVPDIYGPGRLNLTAPLSDFWVLNWQRDSTDPTAVTDVDLSDRPDLLDAIMKSPGPFYSDAAGRFQTDRTPLDPAAYITALAHVRVREVTGRIDFDALFEEGRRLFGATR